MSRNTKRQRIFEAQQFAHNFAEYNCEVSCNEDDKFPFSKYNGIIVGYVKEDTTIMIKVSFTYKLFASYRELGHNACFTTVDNNLINKHDRVYTGADVEQIKIVADKNIIQELIDKLEL